MAEKLAIRFKGRETEILRDIRLYGSISAMMKWGASYIAWIKYVKELQNKYGDIDTVVSVKSKEIEVKSYIPAPSSNSVVMPVYSGRRSLAIELVDAFAEKVASLLNENEVLRNRVNELELELQGVRGYQDEVLADKMLSTLKNIEGSLR